MNTSSLRCLVVLLMAGGLLSGPVLAAKPDHAGKPDKQAGKSHAQGKAKSKQLDAGSLAVEDMLVDYQRHVIRDYFGDEFKSGHCPPGLAKKNNGCLPPGIAKKWRVGYPLPDDVEYHNLPDELLKRLGRLPDGYKLIRVGADILKIAVGTGMIVEAVEDLSEIL